MDKKLILVVLGIVVLAIVGIPAWMDTWNSCTITMRAGTEEYASVNCFLDCPCTVPMSAHNWQDLAQDLEYEMPM
jgi:hypothetical protein